MLNNRQEKIYWKEHIEAERHKIELASSIADKDSDLAMLIPLIIIDGLGAITYPKQDCWNRINKILADYSAENFLKDEKNRKYIYKTYRCILAHGGILTPRFTKLWGKNSSPASVTDTESNYETVAIPLDFIFSVAREILAKLEKLHHDADDYFEITIFQCSKCKKEFLDNGTSKKKCLFC